MGQPPFFYEIQLKTTVPAISIITIPIPVITVPITIFSIKPSFINVYITIESNGDPEVIVSYKEILC